MAMPFWPFASYFWWQAAAAARITPAGRGEEGSEAAGGRASISKQPRPSWLWTKADLCALPAKYGAEFCLPSLVLIFAYLLQFTTKRAFTIYTNTHTHVL